MVFTSDDIRRANDLLRVDGPNSGVKGAVHATAAVKGRADFDKILEAFRSFKDFTPENDPHGEHDAAFFRVGWEDYFFKVDYYDFEMEMGLNPYEEEVYRVITIMEAHER
ncbi:MAG: DUF3768 domain-containing protein [Proteobacteria bacterium]|nr:MAG: DUF3768 domain-containing protein [Pseudomonadota bacterium]